MLSIHPSIIAAFLFVFVCWFIQEYALFLFSFQKTSGAMQRMVLQEQHRWACSHVKVIVEIFTKSCNGLTCCNILAVRPAGRAPQSQLRRPFFGWMLESFCLHRFLCKGSYGCFLNKVESDKIGAHPSQHVIVLPANMCIVKKEKKRKREAKGCCKAEIFPLTFRAQSFYWKYMGSCFFVSLCG